MEVGWDWVFRRFRRTRIPRRLRLVVRRRMYRVWVWGWAWWMMLGARRVRTRRIIVGFTALRGARRRRMDIIIHIIHNIIHSNIIHSNNNSSSRRIIRRTHTIIRTRRMDIRIRIRTGIILEVRSRLCSSVRVLVGLGRVGWGDHPVRLRMRIRVAVVVVVVVEEEEEEGRRMGLRRLRVEEGCIALRTLLRRLSGLGVRVGLRGDLEEVVVEGQE